MSDIKLLTYNSNQKIQSPSPSPYPKTIALSWKEFYKIAYGMKHFRYGADYRLIIQAKWNKRRIERLHKKISNKLPLKNIKDNKVKI